MKTIRFFLLSCLLTSACFVSSQNAFFPDAELFTLDGDRVKTSEINDSNMLTVILFWNMNDPKSVEQLISFNDVNEDAKKDKNIKMIAVCTDLAGYMQLVKPFIQGKAIGIDIYIDQNNELKRLMSVPATPYTFLSDREKDNKIVALGTVANIDELIDNVMNDHLAVGK